MVIQKEEANGNLYQLSLYSTGVLPGMSPRQRKRAAPDPWERLRRRSKSGFRSRGRTGRCPGAS